MRALAALALLAAALSFGVFGVARAHADNVVFGVNDDAGKYENGVGQFWSTLKGVGLASNTITLRWNEETATGFDGSEQAFLAQSLAAAEAFGVSVSFDVYPRHSGVFGSDPNGAAKFAAWVQGLAQSYPQVTNFVVMNECNTSLFVNPQYVGGQNVSAAQCGQYLAGAYDALKAVNGSIKVWGLGLSPRGNPVSTDGSSPRATNPVDWLGFLGAWYRSSGRTKPLMDGVDLHPYTIPQNLPFEAGYGDPKAFSVVNLPRVYQAFYTAFTGTGQPTIGPGREPVSLNEVGVQTTTDGHPGYSGAETQGYGIDSTTGSEAFQAAWYTKLVDFAQCDADIARVNIFHLVDETDRATWQSGLFYAGYVPKASAGAVSGELARLGGHCASGSASFWKPGAATGGATSKPVTKPAKKAVVKKPVVKKAPTKKAVAKKPPVKCKPSAKKKCR